MMDREQCLDLLQSWLRSAPLILWLPLQWHCRLGLRLARVCLRKSPVAALALIHLFRLHQLLLQFKSVQQRLRQVPPVNRRVVLRLQRHRHRHLLQLQQLLQAPRHPQAYRRAPPQALYPQRLLQLLPGFRLPHQQVQLLLTERIPSPQVLSLLFKKESMPFPQRRPTLKCYSSTPERMSSKCIFQH
jgi:hypothetical protein